MKTLTEVLSVQMQLLEELLALLKRETQELADIHLDAMAEVNERKEELAKRIEAHTAPLRRAIEATVVQAGLPAGGSLGELAALLKQKGNTEIPRLHRELNNQADLVRQTAAMNREIAERFAATVSTSLSLLTRVINQSTIYGASGGYQKRPSGAVLINREA